MSPGLPKGISLYEEGDELRIEMRWFKGSRILLTFFMIITSPLVLVFFFMIPSSINTVADAISAVFHSSLFLMMLLFIYITIASYINKNIVTVNRHTLKSRVYPLPFGFKKVIPSTSIKQIYCKQITRQSHKIDRRYTENRTYDVEHFFEVRAILNNQKNKLIIGLLTETEQAVFIEREIESYLGIQHEPVKGGIN